MTIATIIAQTEAAKPGFLEALGIDWKLLILQAVAFLILVLLLGKFVYPHLIKAIDRRQDQLDAGAKAAEEAQQKALEAEENVAAQLKEARKQADEIVATAHKEASDMVAAAEERASAKAEHIVKEAEARLTTEISAARESLKKETAELVAAATEKIISQKLDTGKDSALIEKALNEAKA